MSRRAQPLPDADEAHGRLLLRRLPGWTLDRYYVYAPPGVRADRPPLVSVHGISRNAREHALLLAPLARRLRCLLIAPLFPAAHWRGYQRLLAGAHGRSPLEYVDAVLADAARDYALETARCHLLGFSGGAQFAHRYALLRAPRIASLALSAAGWYTLPDPGLAWPIGIAGDLPGIDAAGHAALDELRAWLALPMLVSVGSRDGDDRNVRHDAALDAAQGATRCERAARFVAAVRTAALARSLSPRVELCILGGARHDFADVMRRGLAARLLDWYLHEDCTHDAN
ncbi:MAG: alpha/beta hydrolase [Steroidobacteraceae bacterium]